MFHSLRSRLLIVNLGLIILGFGSLMLWAGRQMSQTVWDDYGNNQKIYTILLANQLVEPLDDNPAQVRAILQNSAENLSAQLALFDAGGNFVYSTGQPVSLTQSETYVRQAGSVTSSAEIRYENRRLGYVQITTSAETPQSAINQRWLGLGTAFLAFSIIGVIITIWLLNSLTRPLDSLRKSALQIADGDLEHRVDPLPLVEFDTVGTAFNTMAERVSALVEEQHAFASNASHELRTPLTTIRLRTEALQGDLDPTIQAQYIAEIDSEIQRLGHLVDDLMLLSRLDAHRLDAGTEQIDLGRLLQSLRREFAPLAAEKQIALQLDGADKPLLIAASLGHARVVFRNVFDNALKYTPAQGQVTVLLTEKDGFAWVTVADNGRGISAENLPHIGKRFYRTDKARNRQTAGTGLGLALVQSILNLYGGALAISSDGIGKGTRVTVRWPLAEPKPA
ncbi:MAG: HAMP domain-containing histidine kinase [Anaerolineae bacterium]|nr:HAMP domain-containing histidine kinase [Anaerolineae bacterium]